MEYLARVQRGIDFIEDRLHADLSSAEVAEHAGLSSWHFQRIFKAVTNETLKTYIRTRRLAEALLMLETTNIRIVEVSVAAGFGSQQSFTRAFQQAFRITPAEARRHPGTVPRPRKVRIDPDYLLHLHSNVTLEPKIVQLPALQLAGMRTRLYGPESEKNNMGRKSLQLWADFLPRVVQVPRRADLETGYGVLQETGKVSGELTYWATVPVCAGPPAPHFASLCLPPAKYACFLHRGDLRTLDRTVNYIYSNWLLRSGFRHSYGWDLEHYDSHYVPDSGDSLMSYLIPVHA